ncbi:MAG: hypothetical protein KDI66_15540 [Xanthomonadales bacterium]|nr:hypothetical protein [Xanthomonadales bacterium]
MTRLKAFRVHLLASACVGAVVATLVFFLWYPDFYFKASGAQILIATLIFVDVVIGPALTLLLFKPGKWGLAFDMSVIVLLQVGALVYGLSVIIGSRPVFLVAAVDRFVVVSANQVEPGELPDDPASPYRRLSLTGPELVGLKLPEDVEERNRLTFLDVTGHPSEAMPRLYVPFADVVGDLLARARPYSDLFRRADEDRQAAQLWLKRTGRRAEDLVWVPMQARKLEMVMVMARDTGMPLGTLPLDPWL